MSVGRFEMLDTMSIEPDRSNPRIRHLLEIYKGNVDYHQRSASKSSPSRKLKVNLTYSQIAC